MGESLSWQGRSSELGKELGWGTKADEDWVGSWKSGAEVLALSWAKQGRGNAVGCR